MRKRALWALLASLFIALACSREEPPKEEKAKAQNGAQSFKSLTVEGVSQVKNGRWTLSAASAGADSTGKVGALSGINASLADDDGEIKVSAKSCAFDSETSVKLYGGVEARWGEYSATGSELFFDMKEGLLSTSQKVELSGKGIKVTGDSLSLDAKGRVTRIKGGVRAVIGEGVK